MRSERKCERCRDLEQAHDQGMEEYLDLVNRQSRLFRQGYGRAARDLDPALYQSKAKREAALSDLLTHQAAHRQMDSLVPFAPIYPLDIPKLDDDHVALARAVSELGLLGNSKAAVSVVAKVAVRLVEATRRHFTHEEEMMARNEYPLIKQHQEAHLELMQFIEHVTGRLRSGLIQPDENLVTVLSERDAEHINTTDREFASYVHQRWTGLYKPL